MRLVLALFGVVVLLGGGAAVVVMRPSTSVVDHAPALEAVAPLAPIERVSTVHVPIRVPMTALAAAANAAAPPALDGRRDVVLVRGAVEGTFTWRVTRGAIALAGGNGSLTLTTPLNGEARFQARAASAPRGDLGAAISGLLLGGAALDRTGAITGTVAATARPALTADWRIQPNLSAQVRISRASLPVANLRIEVPDEVQPVLDRLVAREIGRLEARLRADMALESAARRTWTALCRSMPLPRGPNDPQLWLELRPTAALAAQPVLTASDVELTLGIRATSRVLAETTTPECPFPSTLELTAEPGRSLAEVAVPADIPLAAIETALAARLVGRRFPESGTGPFDIAIGDLKLQASGRRLLLALGFRARETRLFGAELEGTAYIWGRPILDAATQTLRLADVAFDAQSAAAFDLVGAAAATARGYLEGIITERAVVDLAPFAAQARTRVESAAAALARTRGDLDLKVDIDELRLADIAFDSTVLRLVVEAKGRATLAVGTIPLR